MADCVQFDQSATRASVSLSLDDGSPARYPEPRRQRSPDLFQNLGSVVSDGGGQQSWPTVSE